MAVWLLDSLIPLEEKEKTGNIPLLVFAGLVLAYILHVQAVGSLFAC